MKGKLFQKFLNAKKVESEHLECSKFDENFQIPKTNKFAKKPNQRSRLEPKEQDRIRSWKNVEKKFCHTDESEWGAKTKSKSATQVYTTLNTTQRQWLWQWLIHFGWNEFRMELTQI